MSDPYITALNKLDKKFTPTISKETPGIILPLIQRSLIPVAASSSPFDLPQPWYNRPIAFNVSFFVNGTNNGTNYWTISLVTVSVTNVSTPIASFNTSTYGGSTSIRVPTITSFAPLPATTDVQYRIDVATTLAPGTLYLWPMLTVLRLGN